MCVTVIADDVEFDEKPTLAGAERVLVIQRGICEVEVIISPAVLQRAVHRAIKAMEARASREANVVAFPLPRSHADTA